jgi:hypothetical protein
VMQHRTLQAFGRALAVRADQHQQITQHMATRHSSPPIGSMASTWKLPGSTPASDRGSDLTAACAAMQIGRWWIETSKPPEGA